MLYRHLHSVHSKHAVLASPWGTVLANTVPGQLLLQSMDPGLLPVGQHMCHCRVDVTHQHAPV